TLIHTRVGFLFRTRVRTGGMESGDGGIRTSCGSRRKTAFLEACDSVSDAVRACPLLTGLVELWPEFPEHVRRQILVVARKSAQRYVTGERFISPPRLTRSALSAVAPRLAAVKVALTADHHSAIWQATEIVRRRLFQPLTNEKAKLWTRWLGPCWTCTVRRGAGVSERMS